MKAIKTKAKKTTPKTTEKRYPKLSTLLKEAQPKKTTPKKKAAPKPQRGRKQKYGMKLKRVTFWLPEDEAILKEIRSLIHGHLDQYVSEEFK